MRRFLERLSLGLAVLLLVTAGFEFAYFILFTHGMRDWPEWVDDLWFGLFKRAPIPDGIHVNMDDPLTPGLLVAAAYGVPGLCCLFYSHYLRVQRIRDEMALK